MSDWSSDVCSSDLAPASKASTDLLVPGLRQCRDCHVGEGGARLVKVETATESPCTMCHEYHSDTGKPWQPKRQRKVNRAAITNKRLGAMGSVSAITGSSARGLYDVTWRTPSLHAEIGRASCRERVCQYV